MMMTCINNLRRRLPALPVAAAVLLLVACADGNREDTAAMQALALRKLELANEFHDCERDSATLAPALVAASRCLEFGVAENPAAPDGRRIPLRVMVVPAIRALPEADPFVILVGGPGQAATDDALQILPAFERIRRNRDILLVDQRGTGRLSPFDCDFGEDDADNTQASAELLLEIQVQALQQCLAASAAAPEYYTTDIAVQDLDAIRAHLGYRALNLWGVSYGTRVALAYLRYFPDTTRTVVLDGVAPPGILPLEAARDGQRALQGVLALCSAEADCSAAFPQLGAHYAELLENFAQARDVQVRDPANGTLRTFALQRAQIESTLFQMLYSREATRLIPLFIEELYRGNHQVLTWSEGSSAGINVAMHYSVICSEDLPLLTAQELEAAALDSSVLVYDLLVRSRVEGCRVWPARTLPADYFEPVVSDKPVLVFSATQDPVTPRRWGDQVAGSLGNSLHLVAEGVGHGVFAYGCTVRLISDLVERASLQDLDGSCLNELGTRPFFTTWGGSGTDD